MSPRRDHAGRHAGGGGGKGRGGGKADAQLGHVVDGRGHVGEVEERETQTDRPSVAEAETLAVEIRPETAEISAGGQGARRGVRGVRGGARRLAHVLRDLRQQL